ncbi:juvenile hormone esterase [Plodia interpunctella]|uniref:Carboxylic ester hydrolase n=1 Tax=Plodia interpunctella TaxID=58824 RepID=A0A5B8R4C4_PLOIN|nr:juvenile hormone esterase-like [Plodia interpunctella]QEA03452.1 carboxylesterase [Plodia interpunctella]
MCNLSLFFYKRDAIETTTYSWIQRRPLQCLLYFPSGSAACSLSSFAYVRGYYKTGVFTAFVSITFFVVDSARVFVWRTFKFQVITSTRMKFFLLPNSLARVLCILSIHYVNCEIDTVITTPLGKIGGYHMKTRGGREISAFTGIPYAVPPLGDLRFKGPVPIDSWRSTLDATRPTPLCVQRNPYIRQKEIIGQEDCLYLNIYTPYTSNDIIRENKLLPVMVFIHGGGWMCGDSTTAMYGPEYLLDRDVILVTINYRLGPLGFLSTQDEHCPGNNGLKDQQEALRYIQKTIASFGGDKNSVTLFGESAGGASAHFHMLSDSSQGLFHKAISESGTALVPWAEAAPGEALKNAFRLAKFLGCPQAPSPKMINCLRTKDSYDIIDTEFRFYAWDYEPMTPFKAVVEPDLPGAFLTRSARKIPKNSHIPWLTGLTKDEGCLKSGWITKNETRYKEFLSGFDTIAPVTFYYENSPFEAVITKTIREKYAISNDMEASKHGVLQVYTDSYFAYPAVEALESVFNYTKSSVYLYELAYEATNSFSQIFGYGEEKIGVCHADDLMYLFPIHFLLKKPSQEDVEMSKLIITLWTNFATSGNPNKPKKIPFKWEPATSGQKMEYLQIDKKPTMKQNLGSRSRFWAGLPLWHNVRTQRFSDEL